MTDNSAGERLALEAERRLETPRAAGVAGLVFSLLFVTSMLLIRERPPPGSSAKQIADFYLQQGTGRVTLVGLFLVPFAGIAFVWFIAAIRSHLGEREDRFFATVFLGSGLLFAGMLFGASASAGALIAAVKLQGQPPPDANTFLLARALSFAFLFIFAVRAAAIFMLVASTIGLRTGFLPRWLIFAGYAAGLVFLLVVTYVEWLILLLPAWVIAVSLVILRARRSGPASPGLLVKPGQKHPATWVVGLSRMGHYWRSGPRPATGDRHAAMSMSSDRVT